MSILIMVPLMIAYFFLNRLRGTLGPGGVIVGAITGAIVFAFTMDPVYAAGVSIAYAAGEAIGWGRWLATVPYWNKDLSWEEYEKIRQPDRGDLIHKLANKISRETKNWKKYCITALAIRGVIWWLPVALVGVALGHIHPAVAALIALLGATMPLWYYLAYSFLGPKGYWGNGERLYGITHGVIVTLLLMTH